MSDVSEGGSSRSGTDSGSRPGPGPGAVPAAGPPDGREPSDVPRARTSVLAPPASPASPPRRDERSRNVYRSMADAERSALWRRRLHEAEAGLTGLLTSLGDQDELAGWFALQAELFADLPDARSAPASEWQRLFFRGQALMERFLVTRYGESVLADWARANAEVHRRVEPDHGRGAADPLHRVARQAELYGSDYEFDCDDERSAGPARHAAVTITHCAIWDYREQARRNGVRLTLASPCTYCTEAIGSNIRAKGYLPTHQLRTGPTGHGCRWEATAPDTPEES
ncbi:hypothetical protein [Streptomyces yaizuensis]|uniref:Uncharacterized protein n=1 Tax=Streptomyces yaizuensis TaxID=2989713 RepID=A0ABQ5NRS3_9ACTN|nr:hypothetical protein [Streptomyces sp. YSPA8]GLF93040.1 hypothetical protein SYYSPA8_02105 [Streptomyces sp. YSPA8]